MANNQSGIPKHDLNEIMDIISAQSFMICNSWREYFGINNIKFYC